MIIIAIAGIAPAALLGGHTALWGHLHQAPSRTVLPLERLALLLYGGAIPAMHLGWIGTVMELVVNKMGECP